MLAHLLRALAAALILAAPTAAEVAGTTGIPTTDGGWGEEAFVRQILIGIQPISIAENREICGFVGLDQFGQLRRTPISWGREASCFLPETGKLEIVASFHTHSTYSPNYDSEVPSWQDYRSDRDRDIHGYVATPGGRFWKVDPVAGHARQICGIACLPSDPAFVPAPKGTIPQVLTADQLWARSGG